MECVEGALRNSFHAVKPTVNHHPPSLSDDFTTVIGVPCDDFFVDGFLDFSEDGAFEENDDINNNNTNTHVVVDTDNDNTGFISPVKTENHNSLPGFSIPDTDLCLPVDDVADLEWVSQFVDDSFSGGYSLACPTGKFKFTEKKAEPKPVTVKPALTTPVQTKARSKRARTGGRVWSMVTSPLTDSSTSSSSSSSYTSNPWLLLTDSAQNVEVCAESVFGKPPVKKQKKRTIATEPAGQPRRCSHCLVQKTPQWRAGPLGAKTLCNACGVRYKSGRLLPEYRPACSPTFSSDVHSNNHRKVLEMRQKKEAADAGLAFPVRSF